MKHKSYDYQSKYVLSRPLFLAYILHHCISEFKKIPIGIIASDCIHDISINQKEVHRLSPFITQFEDDTLKEGKAVFDIFFMAHLPESDQDIDFYINIEIQDDFYPGYPLSARGVYYGSRMLSMQYEDQIKGSHYENLKKVYSIWICLNPPKEERGSITEISLDKKVHVGYNRIRKEDYDKLSVILLYLSRESEEEILGFLQTLLDETIQSERKLEILEEDYGIVMDNETRKEIREMCNLGDYVENKGMAKGIAKGIEEATIKSIQSIMVHLQIDLNKAMELLDIPSSEFSKYEKLIKKA